MSRRVVGVQSDGLADHRHRNVVPAYLMRDESQQVERIRVLRLHREDLPVNRLSIPQPPGPMMLERKFKRLLDGHSWNFAHPYRSTSTRSNWSRPSLADPRRYKLAEDFKQSGGGFFDLEALTETRDGRRRHRGARRVLEREPALQQPGGPDRRIGLD